MFMPTQSFEKGRKFQKCKEGRGEVCSYPFCIPVGFREAVFLTTRNKQRTSMLQLLGSVLPPAAGAIGLLLPTYCAWCDGTF